jgi:hypothetical protein
VSYWFSRPNKPVPSSLLRLSSFKQDQNSFSNPECLICETFACINPAGAGRDPVTTFGSIKGVTRDISECCSNSMLLRVAISDIEWSTGERHFVMLIPRSGDRHSPNSSSRDHTFRCEVYGFREC